MTNFKVIDWIILLLLVVGTFYLINYNNEAPPFFLAFICILNLILGLNLFLDNLLIKHTKTKALISSYYIVIPFILGYFELIHSENHFLFIGMMILIWVSDSSAYFIGSAIGKRKLFPKISPKKTWEGFYGSGMCVLISAYGIFSLTNFKDLSFWVAFSLVIWVSGSIGDLVASHVKRIHQIKDSGSLLPGHGGFYDRFDAFIFAMPFILLINALL